MSLLIKALDKAQNAKTEQQQAEKSKNVPAGGIKAELEMEADVSSKSYTEVTQNPVKVASPELELSLSPTNSSFSETNVNTVKPASTGVTSASAMPTTTSNQQPTSQHMAAISAANVFSAKGVEAKTDSARLALIAGAGLIALLGMGLYFYQFVDSTSPIVIPPRPLEQITTGRQIIPDAQNAEAQASASEFVAGYSEAAPPATESVMPPAFEPTESKPKMAIKKQSSAIGFEKDEAMRTLDDAGNDSEAAENTMEADESVLAENADDRSDRLQASFSANKANKKSRKSISNAAIASESASFSVTKSTPQPSVNPVLMSAYEAYNAGKDTEAQQLYKQVLKRDIRNVDALLGLGAIASRQGRSADANAWYGKVLEVDPRNSIAQAALLENGTQGSALSNETSLKNMLAKQPDDTNLHVALGNLYAEQNQWPAAQQAYFDAYSLNRSADNAYNLAVSLDQMGKSKLALPYYQQALAQVSNASNIDKAALSARIAAIE
jgi:tetratricopeptide (TPR) repeat protein